MGAWKQLRFLFDTDDGALYSVRLTELNEDGVDAVFEYLRVRAVMKSDTRFWHRRLDREETLGAHPNVARLVASREADEFHVLASGLVSRGVVLPDLGVFVWPAEVALDYRPGSEWAEPQMLALFELLRQLAAVAPGARVRLDKGTRPKVEKMFVDAWLAFCEGS